MDIPPPLYYSGWSIPGVKDRREEKMVPRDEFWIDQTLGAGGMRRSRLCSVRGYLVRGPASLLTTIRCSLQCVREPDLTC